MVWILWATPLLRSKNGKIKEKIGINREWRKENGTNVVLEMRDISKKFHRCPCPLPMWILHFANGEIHALMGENGAGKSTLIKVLTGVHEFESGSIHMNGENKDIINHSPQEAQANGISTVYQEVNLCPNLTVAENLFIGREPRNKVGMINWKEMNARSAKLLESLNINVPPTQMLDEMFCSDPADDRDRTCCGYEM